MTHRLFNDDLTESLTPLGSELERRLQVALAAFYAEVDFLEVNIGDAQQLVNRVNWTTGTIHKSKRRFPAARR